MSNKVYNCRTGRWENAYISHSASGSMHDDHKYKTRKWENGHWVYEYDDVKPNENNPVHKLMKRLGDFTESNAVKTKMTQRKNYIENNDKHMIEFNEKHPYADYKYDERDFENTRKYASDAIKTAISKPNDKYNELHTVDSLINRSKEQASFAKNKSKQANASYVKNAQAEKAKKEMEAANEKKKSDLAKVKNAKTSSTYKNNKKAAEHKELVDKTVGYSRSADAFEKNIKDTYDKSNAVKGKALEKYWDKFVKSSSVAGVVENGNNSKLKREVKAKKKNMKHSAISFSEKYASIAHTADEDVDIDELIVDLKTAIRNSNDAAWKTEAFKTLSLAKSIRNSQISE